jgi:hypothetical protein
MRWMIESNDGERVPVEYVGEVKAPVGRYSVFVIYDQLGRPMPKIAAEPSGIVQSELGARLICER